MATCEKCGEKYYSKECLKCLGKEYQERITKNNQHIFEQENKYKYNKNDKKINEKEKLFKTIRYAIIFLIGMLITGITIDIIVTSYFIKQVSPTINNMNEMTKDMMETNKKLMKDLQKGLYNPLQKHN